MRISINGKGMEVSDYLRDVITKRVDKLDKYFRKDTEAKVMLSMLRGRQVVEITVIFGGGLLRSEEVMYMLRWITPVKSWNAKS